MKPASRAVVRGRWLVFEKPLTRASAFRGVGGLWPKVFGLGHKQRLREERERCPSNTVVSGAALPRQRLKCINRVVEKAGAWRRLRYMHTYSSTYSGSGIQQTPQHHATTIQLLALSSFS